LVRQIGILQLAAAGQNLALECSEIYRLGREAARPSHGICASFKSLGDGIVHSRLNLTIVKQKVVGQTAEPVLSLFVATD